MKGRALSGAGPSAVPMAGMGLGCWRKSVLRAGHPRAAQFHGCAAPAVVRAVFQAEGHGAELVPGADAGEGLDGPRAGLEVADVADDRADAVGRAQGTAFG